MKCLSRIEMQVFADKEVAPAVETAIAEHLTSCVKCRELLDEVIKDKAFINKMLSQTDVDDFESSIPIFTPPARKRKTVVLRMLAIAAAAIITGFIFLVRTGKTTACEPIPEAEMLMYEFLEGKDLNKLWHDKTQILIIQDGKGNVIQSIITN